MRELLFNKYKSLKKEKYFNHPLFHTKKKYACIGAGSHSLTNIFPLLRHFGIQVKYICTKTSNLGGKLGKLFPECIFTNDLASILNDAEIEGVFVSAAPEAHFTLVNALLKAGKKVFVEKPPCGSLAELEILNNISKDNVCIVGLQRRYWPGNKKLLRQLANAGSYVYQFYFGPYPAGNVFNELFIHAIDYSIFLFGDCSILSSTVRKDKQGATIQLHVKHSNGIAGLLELSSHYSWNDPVENMTIQCTDQLITVKYPLQVSGIQKPPRILNIPTERLYKQQINTKNYFSAGNFIMPSPESNILVLQGFYEELKIFIEIVEENSQHPDANDLVGLRSVYKILDELNNLP